MTWLLVIALVLVAGCSKGPSGGDPVSAGLSAQATYELAGRTAGSNDLAQAEKLALESAAKARKETPLIKSHVIVALHSAGIFAEQRNNFSEALAHLTEAGALTETNRDAVEWAKVHHEMARYLDVLGRYAEAERILRQVVAINSEKLGPEHPETLRSRMNLANTLNDQWKTAEAEAEHRAVFQTKQRVLGPEHPDTLLSRMNMANTLSAQGKYAEAEAEFRGTVEAEQRVFGREHPETLRSRGGLAESLLYQAKLAEAEVAIREVLPLMERVFGAEHLDTLRCRHNLARTMAGQGRYAEAEDEHRAILKLRARVLGPENPFTLDSLFYLAQCLAAQGKDKEARELAKRAVDGAHKVLLDGDPERKQYEQLYQRLTKGK